MKSFAIAAAGLVALTGAVPALTAPAAAQHRVVHERTMHRGPEIGGHHRGGHARQVCTWQNRHHHKVRVCRTVRHR